MDYRIDENCEEESSVPNMILTVTLNAANDMLWQVIRLVKSTV